MWGDPRLKGGALQRQIFKSLNLHWSKPALHFTTLAGQREPASEVEVL